jgi:hypothetical protein
MTVKYFDFFCFERKNAKKEGKPPIEKDKINEEQNGIDRLRMMQ